MDARGIQKYDLKAFPGEHPLDGVAGGLGLVGDDGDLLPHQSVEQRGLAHIGPAQDRYEAGTVLFLQISYSFSSCPGISAALKAWGNS